MKKFIELPIGYKSDYLLEFVIPVNWIIKFFLFSGQRGQHKLVIYYTDYDPNELESLKKHEAHFDTRCKALCALEDFLEKVNELAG